MMTYICNYSLLNDGVGGYRSRPKSGCDRFKKKKNNLYIINGGVAFAKSSLCVQFCCTLTKMF